MSDMSIQNKKFIKECIAQLLKNVIKFNNRTKNELTEMYSELGIDSYEAICNQFDEMIKNADILTEQFSIIRDKIKQMSLKDST